MSKWKKFAPLTVDGDGDALVESVTISADKGWDLPKLVDLEVLGGDTFRRLGLNDLEVNVVCLGNCTNSSGAWVVLEYVISLRNSEIKPGHSGTRLTYRVGIELSECHDCGVVSGF